MRARHYWRRLNPFVVLHFLWQSNGQFSLTFDLVPIHKNSWDGVHACPVLSDSGPCGRCLRNCHIYYGDDKAPADISHPDEAPICHSILPMGDPIGVLHLWFVQILWVPTEAVG